MNEWMNVRSFLLLSCMQQHITFRAKETGFDTYYLPFFLLCLINALNDMEEFDTNCSQDFFKQVKQDIKSFSFCRAVDICGAGGWETCKSRESPDFRSPVAGIPVNSQYHQCTFGSDWINFCLLILKKLPRNLSDKAKYKQPTFLSSVGNPPKPTLVVYALVTP